LLSVKDEVCEGLDRKENVIAYSLDLTAAFDMLRPDTFKELMRGKIPEDMLGMLDEFLSDRKFFVEIDGKSSVTKKTDRGCPQGSVLGPVLFNLYTGAVKDSLPPSAKITSYADDSYVILADTDQEELIKKTEECISAHIDRLEEIGMIVNQSKTEVILFGKDKETVLVNVKGTAVESKTCIKALGVQIDNALSWSNHIASMKKRIMSIIGGVRIIRNKLSPKQTTSVVTAQIFSILYYACAVWLTPSLGKKNVKTVERLHFKALRLIIRDYRQKVSRNEVTTRTNRLPPDKWGKFAMASMFLNMHNANEPKKLLSKVSTNIYSRTRRQGLLFAFDASRTRIGRQSTRNWIGQTLCDIKIPWCNTLLSKNSIRLLLKKTYSTQ